MSFHNQRILRETKNLAKTPIVGIYANPREDNFRYFDVTIIGPDNTPYANGCFKLELFLPEDYPSIPPKCRFLTKIYHPNIDQIGRICLDILKSADQIKNDETIGWAPGFNIEKVLLAIQQLLCEPSIDDPLDPKVAQHFRNNREDANRVAMEWTLIYAK